MKKNITYILNHNLCTGCGICESACPNNAISTKVENGRFIPYINSKLCLNKKGCQRCYEVCPGIGCNLIELSKQLQSETSHEDQYIGKYEKCFVGYSNNRDLRYHAASGGLVTQMLIWLLKTGRIDGAVVTAFDNTQPLMVRTYIATNCDELIQAKGSKYAPVTLNKVAKMIKEAKGTRYAITGLPCHIQGLRKQALKDKILRDKIVAYFGLYCSCGRTFYLTDFILKERKIKQNELTYFAYRDEGCLGFMVAKYISKTSKKDMSNTIFEENIYRERYQSYFHPLRSFFIPKRCLFCIDHYARLADISFGDIHIKPYIEDKIGINSVVVRTPKMLNWLLEAQKDKAIYLENLDVATLNKSQIMAKRKYQRMGAYMKIAHFFGSKTPKYDIPLPINNLFKYSIEYCQTRVQQFIGSHKGLWPLIKILKSKAPLE